MKNLKFWRKQTEREFEILKFTSALARLAGAVQSPVSRRFKILKFMRVEPLKCRFELQKQTTELLKFARFARHEFKLKFAVVLKFIWNFMLNFTCNFTLNFTRNSASQVCAACSNIQNSTPHAYAAYLNPRNSVLHARAAKFENGVKFKGAVKFERSAL